MNLTKGRRSTIFASCLCILPALTAGCDASSRASLGNDGQDQTPSTVHQRTSSPDFSSHRIIVSAAASLEDVFVPIGKAYQRAHPREQIRFNYGSSGTLLAQIEQGAPVDVYVSAGQSQMDQLVKDQKVSANQETVLVTNKLVLVVPVHSNTTIRRFGDLVAPQVQRIAIGTPASVPAGMYAKETLSNLGLWSPIQSKLVYAKDVRQVLTYVEQGDVDAGLVYATDAISSSGVKIVSTAPPDSHSPIVYPAATLRTAPNPAIAQHFYHFIQSPEARRIFTQYGFEVPHP